MTTKKKISPLFRVGQAAYFVECIEVSDSVMIPVAAVALVVAAACVVVNDVGRRSGKTKNRYWMRVVKSEIDGFSSH